MPLRERHTLHVVLAVDIFPAHAEQLGVSTGPRLSMSGQLPQGRPKALCDLTTLIPPGKIMEKCQPSVPFRIPLEVGTLGSIEADVLR